MNKSRDDFPVPIKEQLAKRAGYKCSFPNCGAPTIGPSHEGNDKISNVGVACHISGASPGKGSRRYDPNISSEKRSSIENGIWMCQTHSKLIDTDEELYSIETLLEWKKKAEKKASLILGKQIDQEDIKSVLRAIGLSKCVKSIYHLYEVNFAIGKSIEASSVQDAWGTKYISFLRDFLIEVALNAFTHGKATSIQLIFQENSIHIIDNGTYFNPLSLEYHNNATGGKIATDRIQKEFQHDLIISYKYSENKNNTIIIKPYNFHDLEALKPCSIELRREDIERTKKPNFAISKCCGLLNIILPLYMSISDIDNLAKYISKSDIEKNKIQIILMESTDFANEIFQRYAPGVKVKKLGKLMDVPEDMLLFGSKPLP